MSTYRWEELIDSQDFNHGQQFVTLEDFEQLESALAEARKVKGLDYLKKMILERNEYLEKRLKDAEDVIAFYSDKCWNDSDTTGTVYHVCDPDDVAEIYRNPCDFNDSQFKGGKRAREYFAKYKQGEK